VQWCILHDFFLGRQRIIFAQLSHASEPSIVSSTSPSHSIIHNMIPQARKFLELESNLHFV
jgi:hypothetical protein